MAITGSYFLDTIDFSAATAVFTDINLTTKALDGHYSFNGSVRQQVSGLLNAIMVCPTGMTLTNYFTLNYDTSCLSACTAPVAAPLVDCVVSDWSACVDGTQTRSVLIAASGGGTECPVLSKPCTVVPQLCKVNFGVISSGSISQGDSGYEMNLTNDRITNITGPATSGGGVFESKSLTFNITPSVTGQQFKVRFYKNGTSIYQSPTYTSTNGTTIYPNGIEQVYSRIGTGNYFEIYIETLTFFPFNAELTAEALYPTESIDISRYFIVNAFDDEQCTPPPLYYSHPLSMGYLTNSTVCSDNSQAITVFTSNGLISEGDTIYTNPELTDRLIGGRKFYKNLNEEDQYIKVSDGGIVGPIGSCV
jgi:hypothetical protein